MLAVMQEARELLAKGWCQRFVACDRFGRAVDVRSSDAMAFCPGGAMIRAGCFIPWALDWLGFSSTIELLRWNDAPDRNVEDVLALFDSAIAAIAKQEMMPNAA